MHEPDDPVLAELLARCRRDHLSWINGDGAPYGLPDDGTILGAVGGWSRGGGETLGRQVAVAGLWSSGVGTVEFIGGAVHDDVAWLAMLERAEVELTGRAGRHRWDLRVTEIFRRARAGWERVHRHADPLVDRHDMDELLGLLGEPHA
jgi:hypothetical protein